MSHRLNGRVLKLEQQLIPPGTRRIWQICMGNSESQEDTIAKHGNEPGPNDMVIIFRYGQCQICKAKRRV